MGDAAGSALRGAKFVDDEPTSSLQTGRRPRSLARLVVIAITVAAFGPYLWGGIRTEQAAAYGLAAIVLPFTIVFFRPRGGMAIFVPWVLYLLVASIGAIFPGTIVARWGPGSLLSGTDNVMLPLVVLALVWSTVSRQDAPHLLGTVARLVSVAMACNGVLAIISTRVDLAPLLRPFWATSDSTGSTAELAATLGRYSGVFNQPAEAGALYGIAGLLAVHVWWKRPKLLALLLTLIIIGGLITVSKIFIIGALPLILFYWLRSQRQKTKFGMLFAATVVGLGVVQSGLLAEWSGFNYLARLINPDGDGGAVAFYTAGRLAEGSGMAQVVAEALHVNPFSGVGLAGWKVAYDSAITETLVVGGVLGLTCYAMVILGLFVLASRTKAPRQRLLTYLLAILVVGASLGFTPLAANRVSSIIWLLMALLVLARDSLSLHDDERRPGGRTR